MVINESINDKAVSSVKLFFFVLNNRTEIKIYYIYLYYVLWNLVYNWNSWMPKEEKGKYSVLQQRRKNNEGENYEQELPNERIGKEKKWRKQRKSKQAGRKRRG